MPTITTRLYLFKAGPFFKIGFSRDVKARLRTIASNCPLPVELVCSLPEGLSSKETERRLHKRFRTKRVRGEWFRLDPEDVEFIKGLS